MTALSFGWPQIIYLMLLAAGFTVSVIRHGEPQRGRYNFFASFVGAVISISLLYWGGFFGG